MGYSIDTAGDLLAVGQPHFGESGSSRGTGRVLLYAWRRDDWRERQRLEPPADSYAEEFGWAVDLDTQGETLVVGAPRSDRDRGSRDEDRGAVFVYRRIGPQYEFQGVLRAPDSVVGGWFGTSVAIHGDRIVVGAMVQDGVTTASGAVYVYRRRGPEWCFEQKLVGSNLDSWDQLGASVAFDGTWIVAGALRAGPSLQTGAVFLWAHDGVDWKERARFDNDRFPSLNFGKGCAIGENRLLVVNANSSGYPVGSAYEFDGANWSKVQDFSDLLHQYAFGSVDMLGDSAVVGAGTESGSRALLLLRHRGGTWYPEAAVEPPARESAWAIPITVALTIGSDGQERVVGGDPSGTDASGMRTGVVRSVDVPPILLEVVPDAVRAGEDLSFHGCGALRRTEGLFAVVEIDGVPTFHRVAMDTVDRSGAFEALATVPPGLEGLVLHFQAFGTDETGRPAASPRARVRFR